MAGGKAAKKKKDLPERISMDSAGELHGHVDFLGIETERANKYIYQKLKVVQTWVFVQAFLLVGLIAYSILLTVWLSPFFPMNFKETESEAIMKSPTVSLMQQNIADVEEKANEEKKEIETLKAWREQNEQKIQDMNETINAQKMEIEGLKEKLGSKISALEEKWERAEVGKLKKQVFENVDKIKDNGDDLDEIKAELNESDSRLKELECFRNSMEATVKMLGNETKKGLQKVAKSLHNITGTITDIQADVKEYKRESDAKIGPLEREVGALVNSLLEMGQNLTKDENDLARHITDFQNFAQSTTSTLETIEDDITCLNHTLTGIVDKQRKDNIWAKTMFLNERLLSEGAVENITGEMEENVAELKHEIEKLTQSSAEAELDKLRAAIANETKSRSVQYVHLCEKMNELKQEMDGEIAKDLDQGQAIEEITEHFATFQQETQTYRHDLNDTIGELKSEIMGSGTELAEGLRHLQNETSELRNESLCLKQRMFNAESRDNDINKKLNEIEGTKFAIQDLRLTLEDAQANSTKLSNVAANLQNALQTLDAYVKKNVDGIKENLTALQVCVGNENNGCQDSSYSYGEDEEEDQ